MYEDDFDYSHRENGQPIEFHDFYDLLYLWLLVIKIALHVFELHRLFSHHKFVDNQAKPIIVYLHITCVAMILNNYVWLDLTHAIGDVTEGRILKQLSLFDPGVFLKSFKAYCLIFESHVTIFACFSVYTLIGYWKKTSPYKVFRFFNFPILVISMTLPVLYVLLVSLTNFRWITPVSTKYQFATTSYGVFYSDFEFYLTHLLFIGLGLLAIVGAVCAQMVLILAREQWSLVPFRLGLLALVYVTWMLIPMIEIEHPAQYANLTQSFTLYSCFILFLVQMLGQPSQ